MSTLAKVETALQIMESLGGKVTDGGYVGPRGRVISAHTKEPVQIAVILYRDPTTETYRLEFSMRWCGAQPHQIREMAEFLLAQQEKMYPFIPQETPEVINILEARFGKPKL